MWTSQREHTQMAESGEFEGAGVQSEGASTLGPIEQTPLRVQVAERLRSAIVTGKLRPGTALVETALAEQLGVSRLEAPDPAALAALCRQANERPRAAIPALRW